MLGYSEMHLLTLNLREITHPEDLKETISRFDDTQPGQTYQAYRRYKKADGSYLWVRLSVSKFTDNHNAFYGLAIVEDVSAQKAAESLIESQQVKMVASAKMVALGDMAGGMAHEINNPLTIIIGKLNQVLKNLDKPEYEKHKLKDDVEVAVGNSTRIAKIIKGLLTFSRDADSDPRMMTSIDKILENVENLCRERFHAYGIQLKID
jgi:C4-dicarboxylate-specific signal transduction histidine kinase